jgi:hypothetical protein
MEPMTAAISNSMPTTAASQPNLRPTRLDDYAQLQQLESSHGLLTLAEHDWRAIWLDNPLRQRLGENWPFGWVLEEAGGRIVGQLTNIPTLYTFGGRELIAVTGRAWVVVPEYRGVALWLMDEYFNQPGADLFINTTVNGLAVDAFTTFGSARVPVGDWETAAFWITSYRGFAKTALRLKNIPLPAMLCHPVGVALRIKDLFRSGLPKSAATGTIECIHAFDARFDAFWENVVRSNSGKLLCQRDSRTLTWHFAGPMRAGQLWIFTASSQNLLRAYGIFKRQDHPQSGLTRMRLVDYQTLDPDQDYLPALLDAAIARCKTEGIHTLEHVGGALPKMTTFDQNAPYRRKLPAWPYYYHAADPALNVKLRDPAVWDPSTFDGDASL